MRRIVLLFIGALFTQGVSAEYIGERTVSMIFGSSTVKFGVNSAPEDSTCDYFGRQFIFDATTERDKNILSILLAAHMSKKKIAIWYTKSTASGSDEANGCNVSNMAKVNEIGFSD